MKNMNQPNPMKKIPGLVVCLSAFAFVLVYAQPSSFPSMPRPTPPPVDSSGHFVWVEPTNSLPKFDLSFPGGTPEELVKAIEKATDKPLNTVIPDDCNDLKMPAFSVKNVTVAELFAALTQASRSTHRYDLMDPTTGGISGQEIASTYGFQTEGIPKENSIWFFYWDKERGPFQVVASTVCRFYQLSPYLESGSKVDDITTAVETAWKMLGVTNPPAISFHKDTKVLIAVGKEDEVNLIGDVLKQLSQGKPKGKARNDQPEKSGK
jgi:hypothetical protein